jgi:RNA polymerase sigma factor (sigma-70 family)
MEAHLPAAKKEKELTDAELINSFKVGTDLKYFEGLFYRRYAGFLYRGIVEKCKNFSEPEQLAKDVLQETFIRIFKALPKFKLPENKPEVEQRYIVYGWVGRFADNSFKKVYEKRIQETAIEVTTKNMDEVLCPLCGEFLDEDKKYFVCRTKHYKVKKDVVHGQPISEDSQSYDLFAELFEEDSIIVTNEFRSKLTAAMSTLSEKQKHIILAYANEGCLSSKQHISESTLTELCKAYDTTPDSIKHIKNRALKKLKEILFS